MKKLFTPASALKTGLALAAGAALATGFWLASSSIAQAAVRTDKTPDAMIQEELHGTTIGQATQRQLASAVCGAVKKYRDDSPLIVRTAVGA